MKVNVAQICASTKQSGSALVVLLLLAGWERADEPTAYEIADLAHISHKQAERILHQLAAEGVQETKHRGQGQKNTFRYEFNRTPASDKSSQIKRTSVSEKVELNTPPMSALSDAHGVLNDKSDASVPLTEEVNQTSVSDKAEFNTPSVSTPPIPPYKDNNNLNTKEPLSPPREGSPALSEFVQTFKDHPMYNGPPPIFDQERIQNEVQDLELWRKTLKRLRSNGTPPKNVGTCLDVYAENVKRGSENATNGRSQTSGRRDNEEASGRKPTREERIVEQLRSQDPSKLFPATDIARRTG